MLSLIAHWRMTQCAMKDYIMTPTTTSDACKIRSKMAGLYKVFTYPVVDPGPSISIMTKISYISRPACSTSGVMARNIFRKIFCTEYLRRHKVFPPLTMSPNIHPRLRTILESNTWPDARGKGHTPAEWFANITFTKNNRLRLAP